MLVYMPKPLPIALDWKGTYETYKTLMLLQLKMEESERVRSKSGEPLAAWRIM